MALRICTFAPKPARAGMPAYRGGSQLLEDSLMKIAFFGTGLMGAGFVRRLLAQGHEVRVWNRSAGKAKALEAAGAKAFADPAEALDGVERVHLSLADDASVDAVLEPLAEHLA